MTETQENTIKIGITSLLILGIIFRSYASINLFGYIVYGQWMIDNASILSEDVFSFTVHGREWINHEWLFHLLTGAIYQQSGWFGLKLLHLLFCISIVSALVYHTVTEEDDINSWILSLILPVMAILPGISLKASLVTVLFLILLFGHVGKLYRDPLSLWWLPLLFIFWANLHGGFILGLAFLSIYVLYVFRQEELTIFIQFLLLTALSYIATLINPYGYEIWIMIFDTVADPMTIKMIEEWQPTWTSPYFSAVYIGLTLQLTWSLYSERKLGIKCSWLRFLPILFFGLIALWPKRNLAFYGLSVAVLSPPLRLNIVNRFESRAISHGILIGALLVGTLFLGQSLVSDFHTGPFHYPDKQLKHLEKTPENKNVLIHYPWAEWLLFKTNNYRVFLDLRWKTVYPRSVINNYLKAVLGDLRILNDYKVGWVLLPPRFHLNHKLSNSEEWKKLNQTENSILWRRQSN